MRWLSPALARVPYVIGGGAVVQAASTPGGLREMLAAGKETAIAFLKLGTADMAVAAANANQLQTAALSASVRAIEAMLQQQRSSASVRAALLIAVPVAAYSALRYYGWANCGWATPAQLHEGLESVRATVTTCVGQLGETLAERFACVDHMLTDMNGHVLQVKEELKAEVQAVGETVSTLEQRMAPIETDVHRTAQGVNLLCEVVAGLSNNASPDLLRRLDSFTGIEASRMAPRDALPEPESLLRPIAHAQQLRSGSPTNPEYAHPEFLRALLQPAVSSQ